MIKTVLGASTVCSLSGCQSIAGQSELTDGTVTVKFSGDVSTEEPLIGGADVSTDNAYPSHYSAVVTSKEGEARKIRWKYIEDELPLFVDDLQGTDFDSAYLVFFGMVLPENKQLLPGSVTAKDGTLHSNYRIGDRSSAALGLTINTHARRIKSEKEPNEVKFSVTY